MNCCCDRSTHQIVAVVVAVVAVVAVAVVVAAVAAVVAVVAVVAAAAAVVAVVAAVVVAVVVLLVVSSAVAGPVEVAPGRHGRSGRHQRETYPVGRHDRQLFSRRPLDVPLPYRRQSVVCREGTGSDLVLASTWNHASSPSEQHSGPASSSACSSDPSSSPWKRCSYRASPCQGRCVLAHREVSRGGEQTVP